MTRLFTANPFRPAVRALLATAMAMAAASTLAAEPTSGKLENLLAQELAQRTGLDSRQLQPRALTDATLLPASRVAIPVGEVQPLAILPTGSTISQPEHLQGRSVCVAQTGGYAGLLQARFGAREQQFPSLSSALAALQSGACDALVHDSTVLQALVRLPEWQRFQHSIAVGEPRQLAVVLPASDSAAIARVRQSIGEWQGSERLSALANRVALRLSEEVRNGQRIANAY
jgi:polar amino acid transport system substrate-binding protein